MALTFNLYHKNVASGSFELLRQIDTTTDTEGNISYELPDDFSSDSWVTIPGLFKIYVVDGISGEQTISDEFTIFADTSIIDITKFTGQVPGVVETSESTDFETSDDGWVISNYSENGSGNGTEVQSGRVDPTGSLTPHGGSYSFGVDYSRYGFSDGGFRVHTITKNLDIESTTSGNYKYFTYSFWFLYNVVQGEAGSTLMNQFTAQYSLDSTNGSDGNWHYFFYSAGSGGATTTNSPYWGTPVDQLFTTDNQLAENTWGKFQIGGLEPAQCGHSGDMSNPGYGEPTGVGKKLWIRLKWRMPQGHHYMMYIDDVELKYFKSGSIFPDRGFLHNHGDAIRASFGEGQTPVTYQHLDRKHFWGAKDYTVASGEIVTQGDWDLENTTLGYNDNTTVASGGTGDLSADFRVSDSTPGNSLKITDINIASNSLLFRDKRDLDGDYAGGGASDVGLTEFTCNTHDLSAKTFYYKYSLVYDGNQIGKLSDEIISDTSALSGASTVPEFVFRFVLGKEKAFAWDYFDPRITSINIYRSENPAGPYYFLYDISTLRNDPNLIQGSTGHIGSCLHIEGGSYTPGTSVTDWKLYSFVNRWSDGTHDNKGRLQRSTYSVSGVSDDILYLSNNINYSSTADTDYSTDNFWRNVGGDITLGTKDTALTTIDMRDIYDPLQSGGLDPKGGQNDYQMGGFIATSPNLIETPPDDTTTSITTLNKNWDLYSDTSLGFDGNDLGGSASYSIDYNNSISIDNTFDANSTVDGNDKVIKIKSTTSGSNVFGVAYALKKEAVGVGNNQNTQVLKENTDYVLSMWLLGIYKTNQLQISIGQRTGTVDEIKSHATLVNFSQPLWSVGTTGLEGVFYHRDGHSTDSHVSGVHLQVHFNSGSADSWTDAIEGDFGGTAEQKGLFLHIYGVQPSDGNNAEIAIADLGLYETNTKQGHKFSGGQRVLVDPTFTLPPQDGLINNAILISQENIYDAENASSKYNDDADSNIKFGPAIPNLYDGDRVGSKITTESYVLGNTDKAILFDSEDDVMGMPSASPYATPNYHHYNSFICPNYTIQRYINNQEYANDYPLELTVKCFDKGVVNGSQHPTGLTSQNI